MKLSSLFVLFFSVAACAVQPLRAASPTDQLDCKKITASSQVDDCVDQELLKSIAMLSSEFVNFEKRATQTYAADPKLGKALIALVRDAQNAWINYRDTTCKIGAFEIEKEAPAYVTTISNCIIRMNTDRTKELKTLMQ